MKYAHIHIPNGDEPALIYIEDDEGVTYLTTLDATEKAELMDEKGDNERAIKRVRDREKKKRDKEVNPPRFMGLFGRKA